MSSNNIVKSFKQAMDSFDIAINNLTGEYLYKPQIIYGVLVLFLVLYSAQIAPVLPSSVSNVFNTSFFKLFVFIIIGHIRFVVVVVVVKLDDIDGIV